MLFLCQTGLKVIESGEYDTRRYEQGRFNWGMAATYGA